MVEPRRIIQLLLKGVHTGWADSQGARGNCSQLGDLGCQEAVTSAGSHHLCLQSAQ